MAAINSRFAEQLFDETSCRSGFEGACRSWSHSSAIKFVHPDQILSSQVKADIRETMILWSVY
jgi:hypothetical protein